ncbi:MAG: FGGY family carbohydrate kinase, partial [Gemmatimonadota bacterium]|nr:FGGY family carbohydrate kinase [Gemmatimonadota bacterium]
MGSSSVRAGLYDTAGHPVGGDPAARIEYEWRTRPEGAMEIDAAALVERTVRVIDATMGDARALRAEVVAVATATLWHSILGLDARGEPLTPLYGWGDTRAWRAAHALRQRVDARDTHERTGCFIDPTYPAARLLWLEEAAGDTFSRVAGWLSIGEYLELRLLGVRRCSVSMGSGTGLMELAGCRWDAEMLDAVGIAAGSLSPLVDTDDLSPRLRPEWARRWPELANVPWIPALGDGACANVGCDAVGEGRSALTVGTSAAVRVVVEAETIAVPETLWCYRLDRGRRVMGRALSNAGNGVATLGALLRIPDGEETEA